MRNIDKDEHVLVVEKREEGFEARKLESRDDSVFCCTVSMFATCVMTCCIT
jgi:hypothetical protein